jgi:hypothetical protein
MRVANAIQLAEPVADEVPVFTNRGKPETSAKSARKITRVPFQVSRLMEFCNRRELINQTGHDVFEWPMVVLKELVDNALDECEEAGIAPEVEVEVVGDKIIITDNGRGIPAKTITSVLDYSIRVSSREAYVSPTRGAQGNALKTIMPMGYVIDGHYGADAVGETLVEARGVAHRIRFSVDHIRQEPEIEHTTAPSDVIRGTRVTVELRGYVSTDDSVAGEHRRQRFLALAESYAWLNPHLTLRLTWNGTVKVDVKASDPAWKKWMPFWPTSAHWYDLSRFQRYMAAHISHRGNITVREFVSEFDGMSATAKQKAVLFLTGASHKSLHDFFGRDKVNTDNVAKLLAAIKDLSRPVKPPHLGIIGKPHLFLMMEGAGGEPKTFKYVCKAGETDGLPRVVEFALGACKAGLTGGPAPKAKTITGVNWSPEINDPFRQIGRAGESLGTILERARAGQSQPVISVLHLACPRVQYTDRGKSAIVVEGSASDV